MNNHSRLRQLFADLFGVAPSDIGEHSSPATIPAWDSMGMVNLIVELEEVFHINLELDEIIGLKSFADVRNILDTKGIQFQDEQSQVLPN